MHGRSKSEGVSWARVCHWTAAGVLGLLSLGGAAHAAPADIILLVDNQDAMQDFPQSLPEVFTPGYYPNPSQPQPGDRGGDGPGGHFINTGCTDPALVQAMSFYDKSSADPAKSGLVPYDNDGLNSVFFEAGRFYHSRGRRLAWAEKEAPFALYPDFKSLSGEATALNSCYQVVGWRSEYFYSPVMEECQQCLATQGWWRGPIVSDKTAADLRNPKRAVDEPPLPPEALRKWVVSGGVLNLRPPKFAIARKAIKDVLASKPPVRLGVATFGVDHGWYDPPELLSRPLPDCGQTSLDDTGLLALKTAVNNIQFRHNERPLGEALFGLGGYFSSQRVDNRWSTWFAQPLNPGSFGWPGCCNGGTTDNPYTGQSGLFFGAAQDEWLKGPKTVNGMFLPGQPFESPVAEQRAVCAPTDALAVIAVTAGRPFNDNTVPITRMMEVLNAEGPQVFFDPRDPATNPNVGGINECSLFGASSSDCDYTDYNWPTGLGRGNKNFMDDVTFFLAHQDLRTDMPGAQKVRTTLIGYGVNHPMLRSMAYAGQGQFFQVQSPDALRNALLNAIRDSRTPLP
jgi:hypothetical protein